MYLYMTKCTNRSKNNMNRKCNFIHQMLTWNITSIKVVHPSQITLTVFHCNHNYTKTDQYEQWADYK